METHLFEAKINNKGKDLLFRTKRWAAIFYGCAIITFIFHIINAFLTVRNYLRLGSRYSATIKAEIIIDIVFLALFSILLITQSYYFLQFSMRSNTALQNENEDDFNESFAFLLKHIIIAAILFALNTVWAIYLVFLLMRVTI